VSVFGFRGVVLGGLGCCKVLELWGRFWRGYLEFRYVGLGVREWAEGWVGMVGVDGWGGF